MAINNAGNIGPILPQNITDVNANKNNPIQKINEKDQQRAANDRVELSRQARIISKAIVNINQMSDIRKEMVEKAIQERIVENKRVPAYELAAKLLLEDQ
ncbi:MAG TPA: flagellar biosynthesis anti-sigma factor FlgM [Candidatus Goldiibacteriota bacterium]|nr:flagellar biosynthesis anti-sigma factor FlgM [Candidatus Goldiibacteriota bacterium]